MFRRGVPAKKNICLPLPPTKTPYHRSANLFDDPVEQLAPDHELEHHVVVGGVLGVELVDLHHVRVVQLAEDLHLDTKRNDTYVCRRVLIFNKRKRAIN